jgi:hypothetical protein
VERGKWKRKKWKAKIEKRKVGYGENRVRDTYERFFIGID